MAGNSATLQIAIEVTDNGSAKLRQLGKAASDAGREGSTGMGQLKDKVDEADQSINKASASTLSLGTAVKAFTGGLSAAAVGAFARQVFDASIAADTLNRSMVAISGSQQAAAAEMEFLRSTADRTGQNVYVLAESYRELAASTKGTTVEGEKTRAVFAAVTETSTALGQANSQTSATLKVLSDMASSGVVSLGDLNRLATLLPGGIDMIATASGKTTTELQKMAKEGELLAYDLFPALSNELHKTNSAAAETSGLESAKAAINKMSEAWTELKENIGNSEMAVAGINKVTAALKFLAEGANLRSVWGTFSEGADLARKGLLDFDEFSAATFTKRQQMVDSLTKTEQVAATNFTATWQAAEQKSMADYEAYVASRGVLEQKQQEKHHESTLKYIETERDRADKAYAIAKKGATSQDELNKVTEVYAAALKKIDDKGMKSVTKETSNSANEMDRLAREAARAEKQVEQVGRTMLKQAYANAQATDELEKNLLAGQREAAKEKVALLKGQLQEEYGATAATYDKIKQLSDELYMDMESNLSYWVEGVLKGEFSSIMDAFSSLCDAILDAFIRLIAKMIAEWAMSGLVSMFSGNGFSGFSMPSFSGIGGGSGAIGGAGDYAALGSAALGTGAAAYGWLSGSGTPPQYNIENAYIDSAGNVDYSGQDAANYGSAALTAGKAGYQAVTGGSAASMAPTGLQMAGAGIGAVGGAYGLYNAFGQMAEGKANAGTAVQAAASIYSLYKAYPLLMSAYETYVGGAVALQSVPTTGLIASNSMLNLGAQSGGYAVSGSGAGASAGGLGMAGAAGTAAGGAAALIGAAVVFGKVWGAINESPSTAYTSPTYGTELRFKDSNGANPLERVQHGASDYVGMMETGNKLAQSPLLGQPGIGENLLETNRQSLQAAADALFDILDKTFGDRTAQLAQQLDGSDASVDKFLDSLTGYDVAMSQSSQFNTLAQQAAMGSNDALNQLTAGMAGLGMSEYDAMAATLALVTSVGQMPGTMTTATGAMEGMIGSIGSMTGAVQQFSATPFNIRINAQPAQMSDYFTPHASGGIFDRPTMLASRGGGMHQVAEAGYPEAIVPLRSTHQINEIQDGLTALRSEVRSLATGQQSQQVKLTLVADDTTLARAFTVVADNHVVARNRSGIDPHQRAVY